jgi:hypothetical protein
MTEARTELSAQVQWEGVGVENGIEVIPVVVLSQNFPARPSSIPEIREFVRRCLADSPLTEAEGQQVGETVLRALLDAAGPEGLVQVSFRIFPDHVEVDVLRSDPHLAAPDAALPRRRPATFAGWMADALEREGMSREDAARQLGVSVKTVGRWIGGETEPRLRDLRRIQDVFGEVPFR